MRCQCRRLQCGSVRIGVRAMLQQDNHAKAACYNGQHAGVKPFLGLSITGPKWRRFTHETVGARGYSPASAWPHVADAMSKATRCRGDRTASLLESTSDKMAFFPGRIRPAWVAHVCHHRLSAPRRACRTSSQARGHGDRPWRSQRAGWNAPHTRGAGVMAARGRRGDRRRTILTIKETAGNFPLSLALFLCLFIL